MKITISQAAHAWFMDEMGFAPGTGVRFFGKVYGSTPVHENYSLGLEVTAPKQPIASTVMEGIPYFIEDTDEWFFSGYDFYIVFDPKLKEPAYFYIPEGQFFDVDKEPEIDAITGPSAKETKD